MEKHNIDLSKFDNDTDIQSIDSKARTVTYTNDETINVYDYHDLFVEYFKGRIAGETLMPLDLERFLARSSSKNLKQLVDGKKAEGYEEGSLDKVLSPRTKIAIASIALIFIIVMIGLVIASNMGWLPI